MQVWVAGQVRHRGRHQGRCVFVKAGGLVEPVLRVAQLAHADVVQVEAVRGGEVPGAGCVLPPPLSVKGLAGEVEQAAEDQAAARLPPGHEAVEPGAGVRFVDHQLRQGLQVPTGVVEQVPHRRFLPHGRGGPRQAPAALRRGRHPADGLPVGDVPAARFEVVPGTGIGSGTGGLQQPVEVDVTGHRDHS
ncbi:hypothetical protein BOQ63_004650 (plasmid) [Streptomyces viridifaciens]|nr:hypothetical protein BOQ63_004650 [Streptomyces viridifaciens]